MRDRTNTLAQVILFENLEVLVEQENVDILKFCLFDIVQNVKLLFDNQYSLKGTTTLMISMFYKNEIHRP